MPWPCLCQHGSRGTSKMTSALATQEPRLLSIRCRLQALEPRVGFGVLLDIKFFFFLKEQKYKASLQQPLPLGNRVLNRSIHQQRRFSGRNLTPLFPGSSSVPSGHRRTAWGRAGVWKSNLGGAGLPAGGEQLLFH